MQRRTFVAFALVTLMLSLPLAAAEWRGRGFFEPDTARDRSDNLMHLTPDTDSNPNVRKVYFSMYTTMYPTPVNPNVAATHSAMMQYPTDMHAILGVWKDCNEDGYIGLAEGVLADYASVLLAPDGPCPPTLADPTAEGFVPVHNDGTWVRELLWIGPDFHGSGDTPSAENDTFAWNFADESARVWADWDLPESSPTASCLALPGSRGNFQSTGGFLRWADCLVSWRITGTVNDVANITGLQQISFHDAPKERPDQSASLLNQANPWGHEGDGSYASGAYDCDAAPVVVEDPIGEQTVTDPTGGELGDVFGDDGITFELGDTFVSYAPGTPSPNVGGSPAGTVNETVEEGAAGTVDHLFTDPQATCDGEDDDNGGLTQGWAETPYAFENDQEANPIAKKVQTSAWFNYFEPAPTTCNPSDAQITPDVIDTGCGGVLNSGSACFETTTCTPQMLGAWPITGPYGAITGVPVFNQWYGLPGTVASRNPFVSRESLTAWGGVYISAFAYVDPALGLETPAVPSEYGSPHCQNGVATTGAFECDPAKWYLGPAGEDIAQDFQVRVGYPYNLRDIDCYDHSVSTDVPASLGLIGNTICYR